MAHEIVKIFDIIPVPKPRMTRRDVWTMHPQRRYRVRPCVKSYLEYKEELQWQAEDFELPVKALFDALCPDGDAHISDCRTSKVWGFVGRIIISHRQNNKEVTPFSGVRSI